MKKLFRITTVAESLSILLKGQLGFLNDYYEVVGIASGKENLKVVEEREGSRVIDVPMRRISMNNVRTFPIKKPN